MREERENEKIFYKTKLIIFEKRTKCKRIKQNAQC